MRIDFKRCMVVGGLLASLSPAVQAKTVAEVFNGAMLGVNQRYFESVAGVPRSSVGDTHAFHVQGCDVEATMAGGSVSALRLALGPKCQANLQTFLGGYAPPAGKALTFGGFAAAAGPLQYMADCLTLCGNAADPVVYALWDGPRAADFQQVLLEVELLGDAALNAADAWRNAMLQARGEDYVLDLQFNCDGQFNAQAQQDFKAVNVQAVTIGYELSRAANLTSRCRS